MTTLLAADIGGTKSDLAVFPLSGPDNGPLWLKRYTNAEFTGIEEIIDRFLADCDRLPQSACLAVAGLISGTRAQMTNLPWQIDGSRLEHRFGLQRAIIINDLTALCSSLPILQPKDILTIQTGREKSSGVRGVVAPGTGLGEGLAVEFGEQLFVCGSEGGHADFAPVDDEQLTLLDWMQKKTKPVSYEMLIAGPGLATLYAFLRDYRQIPESAWIVEAMSAAKDSIPIIVAGALGTIGEKTCPLCRRVIELFLSILGSEAGNLALKLYARGGIYLGGGLLPRLTGKVDFNGFLKSFHAKGQMAGFMKDIPVRLILKKDAALIGAARFARQELRERI